MAAKTTKTTAKSSKTEVKTVAKAAAKTTKAAKAYVFFNCNEQKDPATMNILYNHDVFRDTQVSRKALWAKVQEQLDNVRVDEGNLDAAKEAILSGNPVDATQYMHCGAIVEVDCH